MTRREFSRKVRREIIERAGNHCELCGASVLLARREVDHIIPEAHRVGDRSPLTAADGQLLCGPCHDAKTARNKGETEKAKRIQDKHTGAWKGKGRGFRGWRRMDGTLVWKDQR